MHHSGFVNILGKPNAGKSTLMNAMLGEKLSIITPKAQTTRHRIRGILSEENHQIVFSDTPGIIDPKYKLQEAMMEFVGQAIQDADVILYVADIKDPSPIDEKILKSLKGSKVPVLLVFNKIDLGNQKLLEEKVEEWKVKLPQAEILPASALMKYNLDYLLKRIVELLPEGPPFFPKDELTDRTQRFIAAEVIREKIFMRYHKEIPYSCEVLVDEFKEKDGILRIHANIYVIRQSQVGILVGNEGKALTIIGREAREELEKFTGKKIFLKLEVKVEKDWRDQEGKLRKFGYLE